MALRPLASSSAKGLGTLRHIATQFLWIQEKVGNDELDIVKVPGEQNPADLFIKNVSAEVIRRHTGRLGIVLAAGAPQPPRSSMPHVSGNTMTPRVPGRSGATRLCAPMIGPGASSSFH